ncbi:MAG: PAC2 family protein [Candidatus Omnitrophota bacterium]
MNDVVFYKKPRLRNPCLICAWPGMGEVAFKAAMYLVDKLKCEEFAEIHPRDFFYLTGSAVEGGMLTLPGLPYGKFYYWKNPAARAVFHNERNARGDIVIFVSNAQPDLSKAEDYCKRIIYAARLFKANTVITFAAFPQASDHTQQPKVWCAATSKEAINKLSRFSLPLLPDGQVSGMNGLFLGLAKKEGFDGFCLLGEIPLYTIQIDNPKASYMVLKALSSILGIPLDLTGLLEEAHVVEGEINSLLDYLKLGHPSVNGPIGEDEVEKIKKSLSQLTRLPGSVKENIEKLFSQVNRDISKANELKAELDKWNVYKDYEDRFLDLFKNSKEENN